MERFVLNSFRRPTEISSSKFTPTRGAIPVQRVLFIHVSVRECFLHEGIQDLWHDVTQLDFEELSHGELSRCCRAYCKHISGFSHHFLHYAIEWWLRHLTKAPVSEQAESLKDVSTAPWFEMWNQVHPGPRSTHWQHVFDHLDMAAKPLLDYGVFSSTDTKLFIRAII